MKKCISLTGTAVLFAMTAFAQHDYPRAETYVGYNYLRFNSGRDAVPAFSANGGGGQFILNVNSWLSGVVDVGAVHNNDIAGLEIDNTMINFLGGPRFSVRRWSRVTPYIQALVGGVYYTASTRFDNAIAAATVQPVFLPGLNQVGPFPLPGQVLSTRLVTHQTDFAFAGGGGIEIKVNRHVRFRPIGFDYFMTRLKNLRIPGDHQQNNIRYSTGLTFLFGGEKPAPPPPAPPVIAMKTCPNGVKVPVNAACPKQDLVLSLNAPQRELCPGETVQVNPSVSGAGNAQLTYEWLVNGQVIGRSPAFVFGTTDRQPGTYTVSVRATGANYNPATAETTIVVQEYRPPTGTVQANPSEINWGDKSSLTASFQGQCGGAISAPTYTASEGSVQGDQFDSTTVQFDPTSKTDQRKPVTITAKATDARGTEGTATTDIAVNKKAVISPIRLPDVEFSDNSSRVNNCGKRILLEQLRAYIERDPTGRVVLVGHTSADEKAADLDLQRAMNSAAIITAGKGVCLAIPQSQVLLDATGVNQNGVSFESGFCGSSVGPNANMMRRVEVWFVPTGAELPTSLAKHQLASALPVTALGCPR